MKRIWQRSALVFCLSVLLVTFTGFEAYCADDGDSSGGSDFAGGCSSGVGAINSEYALTGPYGSAQLSVIGYTIFYPRQMEGKLPIITWGNGTEAPTNSYWLLLRHLASWGFVVIASNSMWTHSGNQMMTGVDYLITLNETPSSPFYGKLDPDSIGTTGHSQGGGGAITAAKDPRVKCALPIAPARGEIEQVKCPIFLIAGSRDNIVPPALVRSHSYTPSTAPTIFGIVQDMGHFSFLGNFGKARGYITAWFRYQLSGDPVAAQAFVGRCEICNNPDWTVEKKNF